MHIAVLEALLLLLEDITETVERDSHALSALELEVIPEDSWLTNLKKGYFSPSNDVKILIRERIYRPEI